MVFDLKFVQLYAKVDFGQTWPEQWYFGNLRIFYVQIDLRKEVMITTDFVTMFFFEI